MITNNNYIYKQRIAKFLEMTFMAGTGKLFTCGRECYHIFSHTLLSVAPRKSLNMLMVKEGYVKRLYFQTKFLLYIPTF